MSENKERDPKICTGNIETCEAMSGECMECGARECPHGDSAHLFHDGCPSCGGAYDDIEPLVEKVQGMIDDAVAADTRKLFFEEADKIIQSARDAKKRRRF